ncbi:MAG: Mur ligase domain-containing protein, partial [Sporolactobacillus sp.]
MKLAECLRALADYRQIGNGNPEIDRLTIDSRQAQAGSLFFCIKGHTVDGHHFARQAEANGASAIVAQEAIDVSVPVIYVTDTHRALAMTADYFYQQPSRHLHLIGVTGTNGKTTITYLIERIQYCCGFPSGVLG